eukprot:scaffold16504_cov72-Phaeocystis_antarctica.AAC.9
MDGACAEGWCVPRENIPSNYARLRPRWLINIPPAVPLPQHGARALAVEVGAPWFGRRIVPLCRRL